MKKSTTGVKATWCVIIGIVVGLIVGFLIWGAAKPAGGQESARQPEIVGAIAACRAESKGFDQTQCIINAACDWAAEKNGMTCEGSVTPL